MIAKKFILTKKGREAGYTISDICRDVDRIVCATEYDYYGQSSLHANGYFKNNSLVGVILSGNEEEVDSYTKYMVEKEYLVED